jgi:hypothetical protein
MGAGVKRPRREADHSPSSNAEVKNAWSYTFTPPYIIMAWCLVKHRDNFAITVEKISTRQNAVFFKDLSFDSSCSNE